MAAICDCIHDFGVTLVQSGEGVQIVVFSSGHVLVLQCVHGSGVHLGHPFSRLYDDGSKNPFGHLKYMDAGLL